LPFFSFFFLRDKVMRCLCALQYSGVDKSNVNVHKWPSTRVPTEQAVLPDPALAPDYKEQ